MASSLGSLDATAQAALVRSGECSALELVDAAIDRVEARNPELNAVIHPLFDKARDAARAMEATPVERRGPFFGVPFLVKDAVCHTAGDPYHLGMRFLKERGHRAETDSELALRFRRAGFVFVGKTNTPELAMSVTTEPLAYGATHNPWKPGHSPGGSSGGSAAAVAAGLVPVAHANDMGGSIRLPASFCGLVGLKPTRGRSSLAPAFGEYWGPLTHEHVVTRSLRDCAAVLDAIAGPALGDPYTAPPPVRPFLQEVGAEPPTLRVAFLSRHPSIAFDPACRRAVEQTASLLEQAGHRVEEGMLEELARPALGPWIQTGLARDLDRFAAHYGEPIGADDVEPVNWLMAEAGRALDGPGYVAAAEAAFTWARALVREQARHCDVLLTPTAAHPAPPLGHCAPSVPPGDLLGRLGEYAALTMPFDVTGQPAISLPLSQDDEGLPIGVQLVAGFGREDLLLRLASQLERLRPWSERRPEVYAD